MVANHSVQCQTNSHGVGITTIEKANAGILDWCPRQLDILPVHKAAAI